MSKKVLALIPARGGSKRVPLKNFKKFAGTSLLERAVHSALLCEEIDLIVVSTDREDLAKEQLDSSPNLKIQKRSAKASDDQASAFEVIEEVLKEFPGFDEIIYLQPTSPLRTAEDIKNSIEQFRIGNFDSLVSVAPIKSSLFFSMRKEADGSAQFLFPELLEKRTQDLPPVYELNGAIYISKTEKLLKEQSFFKGRVGVYEMSPAQSVDIDDESDWMAAEKILAGSAP